MPLYAARKPPGFAFVEFEDARDADAAIRKLDGECITSAASRLISERLLPLMLTSIRSPYQLNIVWSGEVSFGESEVHQHWQFNYLL